MCISFIPKTNSINFNYKLGSTFFCSKCVEDLEDFWYWNITFVFLNSLSHFIPKQLFTNISITNITKVYYQNKLVMCGWHRCTFFIFLTILPSGLLCKLLCSVIHIALPYST